LEDSLLSSSQKPYEKERLWAKRKMKEQQQRLEKVEKACKRSRQLHLCIANTANPFTAVEQEIAVANFENDTKQCRSLHPLFQQLSNYQRPQLIFPYYHLYTDGTHFTYSLTLVRTDILKNQNQYHRLKVRYGFHLPNANTDPCPVPLYFFPKPHHPLSRHAVIEVNLPPHLDSISRHYRTRVPVPNPWAQTPQLFESDAKPHRYWCLSKYSAKGRTGAYEAAPIGSQFDVAFAGFKKFFKAKTNVEWEARLEKRERYCDATSMGMMGVTITSDISPLGPGRRRGR
jgi:hypothetical protein